jgi:hypothetical protein
MTFGNNPKNIVKKNKGNNMKNSLRVKSPKNLIKKTFIIPFANFVYKNKE